MRARAVVALIAACIGIGLLSAPASARPCLSRGLARTDAREAVQAAYGAPGRITNPVRLGCQRWEFLYDARHELGSVEIRGLSYGQFYYRLRPVSGGMR